MTRGVTTAVLLICLCWLNGCVTQQLTQAQMNAIETREVQGSMEATFSAASGALFDAGYTIAMSDRQGGLLTGTKTKDQSAARFWLSPDIRDTQFTVSMQMRPVDQRTTTVRMKTAINGEPKVDKAAIDQIWVLMQRQVLMKEPLAPAAVSQSPSEEGF